VLAIKKDSSHRFSERNYGIMDLKILAVVGHCLIFSIIFMSIVITDHTAVKANVCWWTRVFGQDIREISIVHRENVAANALSRSPHGESPVEGIGQEEVQVTAISSNSGNILTSHHLTQPHNAIPTEFQVEQRRDPFIPVIMDYLEKNQLPKDTKQAQIIAAKAHSYCILDGIHLISGKRRKC